MTKFTVCIVALASSLILSAGVHSQDVFSQEQKTLISDIKKKMENAELSKLTEAENTFEEAKFILENAQLEDADIQKLFSKGSTPKAEKKSVNVKRNRIEAAKLYEKAYNIMFETCDVRLGRLKFSDPDEKTKAKETRNKAGEKITAATSKGDDYKFLEDKDLETYKYEEIKASIDAAMLLFKEGMELEFEAWRMQFNQLAVAPAPAAEQPAKPKAENAPTADQAPVATNSVLVEKKQDPETIPDAAIEPEQTPVAMEATPEQKPVQEETPEQKPVVKEEPKPVASTPEPKPRPEPAKVTPQPKAKVQETPVAQKTSTMAPGTTYRVQVAAIQRGQLPEYKKQELYSGNKTMYEEIENGFYKYRIGDFASHGEAKAFINEYGKEAFIVRYVNGVKQ